MPDLCWCRLSVLPLINSPASLVSVYKQWEEMPSVLTEGRSNPYHIVCLNRHTVVFCA